MAPERYFGVVILMFSFLYCQNFALDFPSELELLRSIFNATKKEVEEIVATFSLSGNVSPDEVKIIQYLPNGGNYSTTLSNTEGLQGIALDFEQNIVIITHGFWSSGVADWVEDMAYAYHSIGINNTLAIDWEQPASTINYVGSAKATRNVGRLVGDWLVNYLGANATLLQNVHLVGHSLGAHISGFIGKRIFNSTGLKLGRITGLDVAAPLFEYPKELPASQRFSADDGQEVEAYHTDKKLLGFASPVGKQDFYVNYGGPIQPSCGSEITILAKILCSHSFSHEFYTRTVETLKYLSKECLNVESARFNLCQNNLVVVMGEFNNGTSLTGSYYGNTDKNGYPQNI